LRHGVTGDVVAATADRDGEAPIAREAEGESRVVGAGAAGDECRLTVNHPVPDVAALLVAGVFGEQQLAAELRGQLPHTGLVEGHRGRGHRHTMARWSQSRERSRFAMRVRMMVPIISTTAMAINTGRRGAKRSCP